MQARTHACKHTRMHTHTHICTHTYTHFYNHYNMWHEGAIEGMEERRERVLLNNSLKSNHTHKQDSWPNLGQFIYTISWQHTSIIRMCGEFLYSLDSWFLIPQTVSSHGNHPGEAATSVASRALPTDISWKPLREERGRWWDSNWRLFKGFVHWKKDVLVMCNNLERRGRGEEEVWVEFVF